MRAISKDGRGAQLSRTRVVAADAQPLYEDGLRRAIAGRPEFELIGLTRDGRAALDAIVEKRPDVAVVAELLPGLRGHQIVRAVKRDGLATRVIIIGSEPGAPTVYDAIAGGADGYITTGTDARGLCDAISAVARGDIVVDSELQTGLAGEIRLREDHDRPLFSEREREILKLIAEGLTAPAIAARLYLGTATVKTHQHHI